MSMWGNFVERHPRFSVIDDVKYQHLVLHCITDAARTHVLITFLNEELHDKRLHPRHHVLVTTSHGTEGT